ncbi:Asp23/Gls24 family envelope stress response protein [Kyrpidia spormannii]|uniref:Asp23/Gls24 family envelope stress response protein n=2 Tax=Kyrpidia spormannii TaxID=2055160 RepID=A0A2K8N6X6_9BACL|nr:MULTISPECIES: Asp23/Gls24 family envelope stress response protein [Kyrpidia]HHY66863.1 Asp23/Gls24 family envelope stress response protein [Alicyclobacillus sp.]ATY85088.1 Asp23/Gls24 family envelope stress response protein [Kyrpidia spormannii]MCL6575947.1 Asp23/Gls24 family envelope stress response protein [Kyrpidia sp.]CAB3392672.1 putative factor involved in malonyl-CoA synthesis [Kyrpidia spormannii]CAB3393586.1 putative factor involved in malonyl-CoA synthesis [Kyrpidia spormannii]
MPKELQTAIGKIFIVEDVIATIAGTAAMECYGLAGMASRRQVKDSLTEFLGRDNPGRGVEVQVRDDKTVVDLHIIVVYGMKISEVAHNVIEKVRYTLQDTLGITPDRINVYVQGVRVPEEK